MKPWTNVLALGLFGSLLAVGCVISDGTDDDDDAGGPINTNNNNSGDPQMDAGMAGSGGGGGSGNTGGMDASMPVMCEIQACDGTAEECSCYNCYTVTCREEFCACAGTDCLDPNNEGSAEGEFPDMLNCLLDELEQNNFVDETSIANCAAMSAADQIALTDETAALIGCMRKGIMPGAGDAGADAGLSFLEPQCNTLADQQCPEIGDEAATE